jgi:hypothetical protein
MFNHTKVSNNDVHAFRRIPADSLGWLCRVLNTRDNVCDCPHFREIFYVVEAFLPRPHMHGQICPRARFKEGNQSDQRSWVGRRGAEKDETER